MILPNGLPTGTSVPTAEESVDRAVDFHAARHWFALLKWGEAEGLYTYQLPLAGRSGPRVELEDGRTALMLSSYDYLGLIGHPAIDKAARDAIDRFGTGTGGVRMLTGTATLHRDLEALLASVKGVDASMTLSSGYLANLAAITALVTSGDAILLDERAHRSLHDACDLSRATVHRIPHNDLDAIEHALGQLASGQRVLIVVDGVYSMDGDICPLRQLVDLKNRAGALLLVDEAHALGVIGATGRGLHELFGLAGTAVDIWTGSLSKAIPSTGGYVAGSAALIRYVQHAAPPYWFSAALGPPAAGAAIAALQLMSQEPNRLARLARITTELRAGLQVLGFDTGTSSTAIIPVVVGPSQRAWEFARALLERGIIATPIVHPAVPKQGARLRLCATAALEDSDIAVALEEFAALAAQFTT